MSNEARQLEQECDITQGCGAIELIITPKQKDLGGFSVRRTLPSIGRKTVGPWIFFDHMGPAEFEPGNGINVRPHPHVNLATDAASREHWSEQILVSSIVTADAIGSTCLPSWPS